MQKLHYTIPKLKTLSLQDSFRSVIKSKNLQGNFIIYMLNNYCSCCNKNLLSKADDQDWIQSLHFFDGPQNSENGIQCQD